MPVTRQSTSETLHTRQKGRSSHMHSESDPLFGLWLVGPGIRCWGSVHLLRYMQKTADQFLQSSISGRNIRASMPPVKFRFPFPALIVPRRQSNRRRPLLCQDLQTENWASRDIRPSGYALLSICSCRTPSARRCSAASQCLIPLACGP